MSIRKDDFSHPGLVVVKRGQTLESLASDTNGSHESTPKPKELAIIERRASS
jgi:hypothetical protein